MAEKFIKSQGPISNTSVNTISPIDPGIFTAKYAGLKSAGNNMMMAGNTLAGIANVIKEQRDKGELAKLQSMLIQKNGDISLDLETKYAHSPENWEMEYNTRMDNFLNSADVAETINSLSANNRSAFLDNLMIQRSTNNVAIQNKAAKQIIQNSNNHLTFLAQTYRDQDAPIQFEIDAILQKDINPLDKVNEVQAAVRYRGIRHYNNVIDSLTTGEYTIAEQIEFMNYYFPENFNELSKTQRLQVLQEQNYPALYTNAAGEVDYYELTYEQNQQFRQTMAKGIDQNAQKQREIALELFNHFMLGNLQLEDARDIAVSKGLDVLPMFDALSNDRLYMAKYHKILNAPDIQKEFVAGLPLQIASGVSRMNLIQKGVDAGYTVSEATELVDDPNVALISKDISGRYRDVNILDTLQEMANNNFRNSIAEVYTLGTGTGITGRFLSASTFGDAFDKLTKSTNNDIDVAIALLSANDIANYRSIKRTTYYVDGEKRTTHNPADLFAPGVSKDKDGKIPFTENDRFSYVTNGVFNRNFTGTIADHNIINTFRSSLLDHVEDIMLMDSGTNRSDKLKFIASVVSSFDDEYAEFIKLNNPDNNVREQFMRRRLNFSQTALRTIGIVGAGRVDTTILTPILQDNSRSAVIEAANQRIQTIQSIPRTRDGRNQIIE